MLLNRRVEVGRFPRDYGDEFQPTGQDRGKPGTKTFMGVETAEEDMNCPFLDIPFPRQHLLFVTVKSVLDEFFFIGGLLSPTIVGCL